MGIESAVMCFGKKYKGRPFSEVPLDYLQSLKEKDRLRGCKLGFGGTELDERDTRRMDKKNKLLSIPFCVALNYHINLRVSANT